MTANGGEGSSPASPVEATRREVDTGLPILRSGPVVWGLVLIGSVAAVGALRLAEPRSVLDAQRLRMTPAELLERAREFVATTTGWSATGDFASGFEYAEDYLAFLDLIPELDQRREARRTSPPPVTFWYRQSSEALLPVAGRELPRIAFDAPPLAHPGEIALRLDAEGRLVELRRWPRPAEARQREDTWEPVFAAAGLDPGEFRELYARFVPPVPADTRYTWTGVTPLYAGEEIEAEGGAIEGRPTYFRYAGNWRTRVPPPVHDLSTLPRGAFALLVLFLGALAVKHRRSGDDDAVVNRRLAIGAGVVAVVVFSQSPVRLLRSLDPASALVLFGLGLAFAAVVWIGATALGPRLAAWPRILGSWSLLWRGEWRRPEVASGLLVGATGGAVLALLTAVSWWLPVWLGRTAVETQPAIDGLAGGWAVVDAILRALARATMWTGLFALVLELGRMLLRVRLLAAGVAVAAVLLAHLPSSSWGWAITVVYALLWVAILVRWGLLAGLVATWLDQMFSLALIADLGHWAAQTSWAVLAVTFLLLVGPALLTMGRQPVPAPAR